MKTILIFAIAVVLLGSCAAQCGNYYGGYPAAAIGGCGCGACGGFNGLSCGNNCGPRCGPFPVATGCGCGVSIPCDPCYSQAALSPLNGPGSPFCGPCGDPISACLFKKLRDYQLEKKKCIAQILLKNNVIANKLLC